MLNSARFWVLVSGLILTVLLAPLLPNWQVNAQEGQPSLSEFEQAASEVGKEFQESKQEELDIQLNPNISEEEKVDKLTEIRRSFIDVACGIIDNFVNCDPAKIGGTPAKSNSNVNQGAGSGEDRFKLINEATQKCFNDGGGDIDRCYEQVLQKHQEVFDACIRNGGNSESCSKEANNSLSGVKVDPAKSPTGMVIEGVDCGANSANSQACESYIKNMTNACNAGNKDGCSGRDGACKGFEDYCKTIAIVTPYNPCNQACRDEEKAKNKCEIDFPGKSGCDNPTERQKLYNEKDVNEAIIRYDACKELNNGDPNQCEPINPYISEEARDKIRADISQKNIDQENKRLERLQKQSDMDSCNANLLGSERECARLGPDYVPPLGPEYTHI